MLVVISWGRSLWGRKNDLFLPHRDSLWGRKGDHFLPHRELPNMTTTTTTTTKYIHKPQLRSCAREHRRLCEAHQFWRKNGSHSMTGWCLNQPIWKICSSNWIISPGIGMKIKRYLSYHHLDDPCSDFTTKNAPSESNRATTSTGFSSEVATAAKRKSCASSRPGPKPPKLLEMTSPGEGSWQSKGGCP